MTVFSGFTASTLGMMAQAHSLNVISHNIANISTGGFKRSETRFETVLGRAFTQGGGAGNNTEQVSSSSDFGGVRPFDLQHIDTQGRLVSTDRNLDLAINGRGFFILNTKLDGSGETLYTRDGSLKTVLGPKVTATTSSGASVITNESYLADGNGNFVLGFAAGADGTFPTGSTGTLAPLRVDSFAFSNNFTPTTTGTLSLNLPAADSVGLPQVDVITLGGTVEAGDSYSVTVDGTTVTYNVTGAEADIDAIRDAVVAAINADATVGATVTATSSTVSGEVILTAKALGGTFASTASATNGGATGDNTALAANAQKATSPTPPRSFNIDLIDSTGRRQTAELQFQKSSATNPNQWQMTVRTAQTPVAQVDTVTVAGTIEAGDTYTVTIDGNVATYVVTGAETGIDDVRDALITAINGTTGVNVTAAASGTGAFTLTADSAGTPFTASAAVTVNGAIMDNTAAATTTTANVPTTTTSAPISLVFDANAQLLSPTTPISLSFTFPSPGGAGTMTLDVSGLTQFATDFLPFNYTRDGLAKSEMTGITFDQNGHVIGSFEDGTFRKIYKIPFATFSNPNALAQQNGNTFSTTAESGTAAVRVADIDGFASFAVNTREISNVDLGEEFSRLIVTQNAYNSSATVFKTVNEMLTVARDLKR